MVSFNFVLLIDCSRVFAVRHSGRCDHISIRYETISLAEEACANRYSLCHIVSRRFHLCNASR